MFKEDGVLSESSGISDFGQSDASEAEDDEDEEGDEEEEEEEEEQIEEEEEEKEDSWVQVGEHSTAQEDASEDDQENDDDDDEDPFTSMGRPELVAIGAVTEDQWYACIAEVDILVKATLRRLLTNKIAEHTATRDSLAKDQASFDPRNYASAQLIRGMLIEALSKVLESL
jgi:hypothetical protein